jgi:hypothetical protein
MENIKFKIKITLDRHDPRLIPNHCHLAYQYTHLIFRYYQPLSFTFAEELW